MIDGPLLVVYTATMDERGTRTLTEAVSAAVDAALLEVRTATPARIESYSASDQRVAVLPLLKRKSAAGELLVPKPIGNVPILFPRAGGFALTFPVAVGDVGLLLCSDRSLDLWLASDGGQVDPQNRRHHEMTDGVFLPGLHSWSDPIATASASDLVLAKEDGSIQVRLLPSGVCEVRGAGATTGVIVDGTTSLHGRMQAALTELTGLLAGFGLLAPTTTALAALFGTSTWTSGKLEAEK